jgi:hypothetical protein
MTQFSHNSIPIIRFTLSHLLQGGFCSFVARPVVKLSCCFSDQFIARPFYFLLFTLPNLAIEKLSGAYPGGSYEA